MLLGSSPETPYDLRFQLFRIPVRVHPIFWLVMVLLSNPPDQHNLLGAGVFVACALVSILVHELGHGLMGRALGYPPQRIVLYAMGGYCEFLVDRQVPWRRLLILLAGPGAGFGLLALTLAVTRGEIVPVDSFAGILAYHFAISDLVLINLFWGILNLLPIWPLDGGQIAAVLLKLVRPYEGERWAHILSLLVAGGIAILALVWEQIMPAVGFGYFGYINYQILQSYHDSYSTSNWD